MNDDRLSSHLMRLGRAFHKRFGSYSDSDFQGETCPNCGINAPLSWHGVLWPELVLQWKLTPAWANWMDQREGLRCTNCRSNIRSRQLAQCIVSVVNKLHNRQFNTLTSLCEDEAISSIRVAEINAAGDLHTTLSKLKNLSYSEYGSADPAIPSEDLQNLSYKDETFDLVITSDVLEHVPDYIQALAEIRRILRPNAYHIFTVPIIRNKIGTVKRAELINGQVHHILTPSYHGAESDNKNDFLVFHEFGDDFVKTCSDVGFSVSSVSDPRNPSLITLIAKRI